MKTESNVLNLQQSVKKIDTNDSCQEELVLFQLCCTLSPRKLIVGGPNKSRGDVGKIFKNLLSGDDN